MDTDQLYIHVASCARGKIQKANMPRAPGRATAWNEQTTNIEIVLAEQEAASKMSMRAQASSSEATRPGTR